MSGLLAVKLRRDLRATWSRYVLMVVAIAVSLTVFSAVLYTWSASDRETQQAYLSTAPASATIRFGPPVDAEEMAVIAAGARTRPGVIEATGRTQFTGRVQGGDGRWRENSLQVFVSAPDDPMRMATFEVQQGSWPPAAGEILLGRDTFGLLDVAVGDTVVVEAPTIGGDERQPVERVEPLPLRVAGVIYDPSLAPAAQGQTAQGYLSASSLATLGGGAVLDQLKIQVGDPGQVLPSRDRDAIVAVAADVGTWLEREHGLAIREIQVPEPYEHPHKGQADALLLSLLAGGGIALLLATILVANMLNNLFAQQIPQIGIMKAIGARSARIARLYLAMTLLVAAAATVLAMAPGILIGRAAVSAILGFLGIVPASLAAPGWTYLVVLGAGLILPVLMALVPLVRTSRTTVRAAIDHSGLGSNPRVATRLLGWLGRVRRLDRGLLMALRNTIRRPARFLLSVGLLASAGTVFVAGISLGDGLRAVAEEAEDQIRWDVEVRLASATSVDDLAALVEPLPDISRVEGWTSAAAGVSGPGQFPLSRTYPDQGHGSVSVTAVPADTTMLTPPKLLEGRWLEPGETGAIVLNQIARADTVPGISAGDTVELFIAGEATTWRVVGIAEERGGGSGGAYVTALGLAEAMGWPLRVNTLRIATDSHDERTREAVADAIDETLTGAGVEVQAARSVGQSDAATQGHLGPIITVTLAVAIAIAVVGFIGLASTMSANILDRTREFGVMHAIGARPKAVRRIVIGEGVFLALASFLLAVIPALGLTAVMGAGLGNLFMDAPLPFRVSILGAGIWIALVVLGAVLATDAAATRAARLTVREALDYL
ncbi:MAG: FtsX-like permease family protein [Chloroflexota bacterium]